jgi:serine/threonine-protein kinase
LKERPALLRQRAPEVPESFERLIAELLEKDPKDRPVDAHRVHADLVAIANTLGVGIPRELGTDDVESRGPAKTLPPVAIDQWARRTVVFDRMLRAAHPHGEQRLGALLDEVKRLVQEIGELRARAVEDQRALETIESRGREVRQRFGHAVDALGVDASRARDELKAALGRVTELNLESDARRDDTRPTLTEVLRWEGRSGGLVPMSGLSDAYRAAADAVDRWLAVHERVQAAEAHVGERRGEVEDLEFQIEELRTALVKHEEQLERELSDRQREVESMGRRADDLEKRLLGLATDFCAPLRRLPALEPLFIELETGIAA